MGIKLCDYVIVSVLLFLSMMSFVIVLFFALSQGSKQNMHGYIYIKVGGSPGDFPMMSSFSLLFISGGVTSSIATYIVTGLPA